MPSGLARENVRMPIVAPPSARQNDVIITIFFLAPTRSVSCRPVPFSSVLLSVKLPLVPAAGLLLFCSKDVSMVPTRDIPHFKTASSTMMHMHRKATQATLVAVCGYPAEDRTVPATAPMQTEQRVACCPIGL